MSGGEFYYKEYELYYLALKIKFKADSITDPEVKRHMRSLSKKLMKTYEQLKKLDYYLSGDSTEYK
jgi:hypothetical protein